MKIHRLKPRSQILHDNASTLPPPCPSIFEVTPSPSPRPPCARRWRGPKWATTCLVTIPPCCAWKRAPRKSSARKPPCSRPPGTMANQLAIRAHTEPGDEILVDANAHIYYYESGAPAALSGVMCRCLPGGAASSRRRTWKPRSVRRISISRPLNSFAWRTPTIAAAATSGRSRASRKSPQWPAGTACAYTSTAHGCGTPPPPPASRSANTRRTSTR